MPEIIEDGELTADEMFKRIDDPIVAVEVGVLHSGQYMVGVAVAAITARGGRVHLAMRGTEEDAIEAAKRFAEMAGRGCLPDGSTGTVTKVYSYIQTGGSGVSNYVAVAIDVDAD